MRERPEPKPITAPEEARGNHSYIIRPSVKPKKDKEHGETVSHR